ncbi:MAG: hypothetical protein AB7S86_11160 [Hydrogenophaga sp.]|uniref:hypothetical protein n=1 Tax=Hydrogenophaga sp. TaxID=1904254 RepID=UPI003D13B98F
MATLPNPARGEVIFHAACRPALGAGEYSLRVAHELKVGGNRLDTGSRPLPAERVYPFAIDAPRFTMDPSMIHAVFPPTNGVGSYVSRLPMIVLRRRTLPWERQLAPGNASPWLAVLLFEKGEATTLSPCTVRDVLQGANSPLSPRLNLPDVPEAMLGQPCLGLEIPLDLFQDIAPMQSEIGLLTHVRQVNTEDKELMGMDDDGWFAVVVGNRLPEPGKKYEACLVSLEGTQAFLPTEAQTTPLTAADLNRPVVADFAERAAVLREHVVVSESGLNADQVEQLLLEHMQRTGSAHQWAGAAATASVKGKATSTSGNRQAAKGSAWVDIEVSENVTGAPLGKGNRRIGIQMLAPKVRLFMLAQWSFECREGGDFEAIMQALPRNGGVAMLGLPPSLAQAPGGTGAAVWRAALDTGHVPLPHLTRDGEQTIAWYRGPLTPVGVRRETVGPYHHADQARRLDPATGLENLGYAAAFEIGRLMALGDPRFALDLMHWRRDGRLSLDVALFNRLITARLARPGLLLPELLNPRAMLLMPRILTTLTARAFDGLMKGGRLGALRDPTGLVALRERLPGLDATQVAEAKGLNLQVVQSLLGSVALSGTVLDEIGFARIAPQEARLDVLAQNPQLHFAPQVQAFEGRLGGFRRPL